MGFLIGLLTFVLVLNCIVLILLVLMQLPKKDAGAGLAFGGGATDALFGAGSGNVLTKATKYCAIIFFVLAVFIGVLQTKYHDRSTLALKEALEAQPAALPDTPAATAPEGTAPIAPPAQPEASATAPTVTNFSLETALPEEDAAEGDTNSPGAQ
jgi:preprotein translocase subunit SecG